MHILLNRLLPVLCLGMLAVTSFAGNPPGPAAAAARFDYAEPPVATGTIYESGPDEKKVLFTCKRTATRSNAAVHVECEYVRPDGSVAARERLVYEADRLVSYEREDLQANRRGGIVIRPDLNNPKAERIYFEDVRGRGPGAKKISDNEVLAKDTLVNDTIYPFILAHWKELTDGAAVKFRFISLERATTYGFQLKLDSETTWRGRPVVRLKMEATNLIVAQFINPIYFYIEKASPHRIFKYSGRITPRVKNGTAWKQCDAETVIDWQ